MARQNLTLALTTGVWTRLSDLATAATALEQLPPQWVVNFSAQLKANGAGFLAQIGLGIPNGVTPTGASGQLTSQIAPSTPTAPGGQFYQNQSAYGSPLAGLVDITRAWVNGTTGDFLIISWDSTP
jgi:hypothetical protein